MENVITKDASEQNDKSIWPFFDDWVAVTGAKAELIAGRHRVEALKENLQRRKCTEDERW